MSTSVRQLSSRFSSLSWPLIGLMMGLSTIGIIMMLSAGGGEFGPFALAQAMRLGLGLILMLAVALLPMRVIYNSAFIVYFVGVLTLIIVDIVGHIGMGAQRWIRLGGMNLQPSELMKVAVILALARFFHSLHGDDVKRFMFLIPPVLIMIVPAIFILRQPNLGTTAILIAVGGIICFGAGIQLRYFFTVIMAAIASAPVAWHFLHDYQKRRVLTFLDPTQDPLGAGYNIMQSMIAIGSGGMFGKGYLQGSQGQLNFLPEKHTDFIFTMYAEEWGFIGSILLLGLYTVLMGAGLFIASVSKNTFGALIAVGVTGLLFVHVFINMAMVMGLIPVVGVPLPFLSYGGSIMISTMIAMGLLLNAHIHRNVPLSIGKREFL